HLIYYKGDPKSGDIFYVRQQPGDAAFSTPIRVNSQPGSAISMGTIRGAQISIGRNDRVHVAWNGSGTAEPKGPNDSSPMLYTRLNEAGTAFEPQRNVMTYAKGLDGGGTVAADKAGNVYVAWHGNPKGDGEAHRAVYVARSTDDGKTFAREKQANTESTGACGCCAMRAFVDKQGTLYMLYRAATADVNRDMTLLVSHDKGTSFQSTKIHKWNIGACPMSSESFTQASTGVEGAWETKGQVYFAAFDPATMQAPKPVAAPGAGEKRKHPVIVTNAQGQTLFAWTEGTGWERGGALAWQVYDKDGNPTAEKGQQDGVPVWSLLSAFARPDGSFTLIY
ncbi:MAG: exo-alpha-sialidase, partial [Abitibacteriaceae bacterium]|nr:exo-alpha-sialidase [Abditibacteriaceae bacterium]